MKLEHPGLAWLFAGLLAVCAGAASAQPAPSVDKSATWRAQILNPDHLHAARNPRTGTVLLAGNDASLVRLPAGGRPMALDAGQANGTLADLLQVAFNPAGTVALAAGDAGTLLRSTDDGLAWQKVAVPSSESLRFLLPLPASGVWLASGPRGQVLRSADDGLSWQAVPIGADLLSGRLALGASGRVWLAGEAGLVAASDDLGLSWQVLHQGIDTPALAVHEADGVLLAPVGHGRMLRSADGGRRWQLLAAGGSGLVEAMLYLPEHRRWLAITHQGECLLSDDAGQRWRSAGRRLEAGLTTLWRDPRSGDLLALGHAGLQLRSSDGGLRWQARRLAHSPALLGFLDRDDEGLLAWGHHGAIYRSDAAGQEWQALQAPQPEPVSRLLSMPDGSTVLAAGLAGRMLRSNDLGRSWQPVPIRFVVDMYPTDFMALATPGDAVALAAGATGSIMRSDDGGRQWRSVLHLPYESGVILPALVTGGPGVWLAPSSQGGVFRSRDDGLGWQRLPPPRGWPKTALLRLGARSPHDGSLLLAGMGSEMLRSTDQGGRWQRIDLGRRHNLFALLPDESGPRWWAAGADGVLLRSDDAGRRWRELPIEPLAGHTAPRSVLRSLLKLPASGGHAAAWLVAGRAGALAISDDGERFRQLDAGTSEDLRLALAVPGRPGQAMLVGRSGVILHSSDNGRHWQPLYSHTRHSFEAASFMPDGSLLAVGARMVLLIPPAGR